MDNTMKNLGRKAGITEGVAIPAFDSAGNRNIAVSSAVLTEDTTLEVGSAQYPDLLSVVNRIMQSPAGGTNNGMGFTGWDGTNLRGARFKVQLPPGVTYCYADPSKTGPGGYLYLENVLTWVEFIGAEDGTSEISPYPGWDDSVEFYLSFFINACLSVRFIGIKRLNCSLEATKGSNVQILDSNGYVTDMEFNRLRANYGGNIAVTTVSNLTLGMVVAQIQSSVSLQPNGNLKFDRSLWPDITLGSNTPALQATQGGEIVQMGNPATPVVIETGGTVPVIQVGNSSAYSITGSRVVFEADTITNNSGQALTNITENQIRKDGAYIGIPGGAAVSLET